MAKSIDYKTIMHVHDPGDCHELTFSCNPRAPRFDEERFAWLSECVTNALEFCRLKLVAFVFMPEHTHLIVYPDDPAQAQISRFLKAVKQPLSARIRKSLMERSDPLLDQLIVKKRNGKLEFRFWQQGPVYDRNLNSAKAVLAAIDYVHLNPVRRELCAKPEDWVWSSVRHYADETRPRDERLPPIEGLPATFLM